MRTIKSIFLVAIFCLVTIAGYPLSSNVANIKEQTSYQQKKGFTVTAEVGRYNSETGEVTFTSKATLTIKDIKGTPTVVAIGSREVKLPIKIMKVANYNFMCFEGSIVYCFNSDKLV